MSWNDYGSVFIPSWLDENLWLNTFEMEYKRLSTQELYKKYRYYEEYLKGIRQNEPPRKRGRKSEYKSWVSKSHDIMELLDAMAKELQSREDYRSTADSIDDISK